MANIRTHDYYERLYYVGNDTFIQESRYLMDNNSWTEPAPISTAAAAHLASPIGVTMVDEEIWLFWFADDKQLQYATSTNNGSEWSTGELSLEPYLTTLHWASPFPTIPFILANAHLN